MKSIASLFLIVALGFGLVGCPGSGGGGGGTGTASGSFTRVALVPNRADNTVSIFLVDDANGRLRPRGYVVSGTTPRAVAVHPSGRFFYTINGGSNNISAYALSSTGLATAVTGSPFTPSNANDPTAVVVSPDGQFLFVASRVSNNVSVLSINAVTGALTEISSVLNSLLPATGPTAIAVHPSGNLIFVTNNANNPLLSGTLSVFIHSAGLLTPVTGSPYSLLRDPQSLASNEAGTVVYVANKGSDRISAFSADQITGVLTLFDTEVLPGTAPSGVAVGPGGQFLYVANSGTGTISWIPIDPVTGALVSGGSNVAVVSPEFIRIDPAGKLLYATDSTSDLASFFSINPVAGTLTPTGTRAMRGDPAAVAFVSGTAAVTPTPTVAYVANAGDDTVSAFAVTPVTGFLTPIVGSPFSVAPGTGPIALSADPLGQFMFVGNSGTNDVSAFTLNGTTGSLTGITGSPFFPLAPGTNPQSVAADPLGRYMYVANQSSDNLSAFAIASGTGILTAVGLPVSTGAGTGPRAVTVEPSGRFAYVVNATTNEVRQFSIQANGALVATGVPFPLAVTAAPRAITVEPSGRFLYVANNGTNTVSAYLIASADGALTGIGSPVLVTPGTGPVSLSADPLGKFLYVANQTSDNVSAFAIDQATGALTPLAGSPFVLAPATFPQSITVDLSGRLVYVVNGASSNNVSAFVINQSTGVLSAAVTGSPFTAGINPSAITTVGRF
jgi:6-phosphogluconolactonase (cycloisomerase 2 family)